MFVDAAGLFRVWVWGLEERRLYQGVTVLIISVPYEYKSTVELTNPKPIKAQIRVLVRTSAYSDTGYGNVPRIQGLIERKRTNRRKRIITGVPYRYRTVS